MRITEANKKHSGTYLIARTWLHLFFKFPKRDAGRVLESLRIANGKLTTNILIKVW